MYPRLKPIVGRRMRTQFGLVQGLPRASAAQHVENRVSTASIRHTWSSAAKAMRIEREREQRLQDCPQFIGDPKPGRGPIIGRPLPASFLEFLFAHTSHAQDTVTLVIEGNRCQ